MRQAALIYNPSSGRQRSHRLVPEILGRLQAGGYAVEPMPTGGPGDATRLAREASRENGLEVVFALGGDGTLREVASGLLGSPVALGPLPAGTANVLTLALDLPRNPLVTASILPRCEPREIDVGLVGGEPFLMMVSCGLDGAVMAAQSAALKRRFGRAGIVWAGLGRWWSYGYPEIELDVDGERLRATLVAACNIPFYGGRFRMAPEADFRDGRLDLVLFQGRGRRAALSFLGDLLRGRHHRRPDVVVRSIEKAEILGPPDLFLQVDGDALPLVPPLTLGLARERLRVLMPCAAS